MLSSIIGQHDIALQYFPCSTWEPAGHLLVFFSEVDESVADGCMRFDESHGHDRPGIDEGIMWKTLDKQIGVSEWVFNK